LAYVGGYPEPLRKLLGIWSEETDALYDGQTNRVVTGSSELFENGCQYEASELCELVHTDGADVLANYVSDFYAGRPAVTRNAYGKGQAIYVASRNEQSFTNDLLASVCTQLDIKGPLEISLPEGVTIQSRSAETGEFLFFLNCTDKPVLVDLGDTSLAELDGGSVSGNLSLDAFGSRILVCRNHEAPQREELLTTHTR
jgi:beta-galactosidase